MDNNILGRRNFLRTSVLGGAGILVNSQVKAQEKAKAKPQPAKLITRKLGRTGIEVPIVSFGVMRADTPALIHAALEEGMVMFDTAHGYQNGKNEEMLGEELKKVPRSSFIMATKVKPDGEDADDAQDFIEKFEKSLKRLQMTYVDILYVHAASSRDDVLAPEIIKAAMSLKTAGKARFLGVSTHRNEAEVIQAVMDSGVYDVVLTSINYKQAHYPVLKEAIAKAAKAGIGIVAMKTMAGGFHDKARTKPINCKAALKFVMQDENITTAIPGITNFEMLAQNASVNRDLTLTKEEQADLMTDKSQGSLYCNGCEHCVADCPKGLPIPDLMRAYMYTYGYKESKMAHTLIRSLDVPANPCVDCAKCAASCVQDFNISDRITDVMRLKEVPEEFLA